jgi:hypothetical protein
LGASSSEPEIVQEAADRSTIELTERLYVPHRKRLAHAYTTNADGVRELRIDYGIKEVTFDEEHLFPFGERVVQEPSFTGADAIGWGPGYRWDELRPLLQVLVDEGIIKRGGSEAPHDVAEPRGGGGLVPSPMPPSTCPVARTWSLADCESISRDLANHALEIGHIEAVIPVYRIAHPALDADGRQVGEANVFPARLRLDVETEWRICQYSGSRYRDDLPMNVTGLKAMIKHWKPMMATLLAIRDELGRRLGTTNRWTIGQLHLLACVVLAAPGYQLMKGGGTSPQRPLHPVVSSLFRITDGIRMTTYEMLFSVERTRRADEPLSAAQVYDYVEVNAILVGDTGVCAGPRPLIEEFLATAVDGAPPDGIAGLELPADVRALLAELPAVMDYGLYGMQAWGTSLSVWLEMSRTYQAVMPLFDAAPGHAGSAKLVDRLRANWKVLQQLQIAADYERDVHLKAYAAGYEPSWRAAGKKVGPATLAEAIAPVPEGPAHRAVADQLRTMLRARAAHGELAGALDPAAVDHMVGALVTLIRHEQGILTSTATILGAINALLDRAPARRPLGVRDFLAFYGIASRPGAFPYLFDTLDAELGIRVDVTASTITATDRRAR